jgi:hypothetical protein
MVTTTFGILSSEMGCDYKIFVVSCSISLFSTSACQSPLLITLTFVYFDNFENILHKLFDLLLHFLFFDIVNIYGIYLSNLFHPTKCSTNVLCTPFSSSIRVHLQ